MATLPLITPVADSTTYLRMAWAGHGADGERLSAQLVQPGFAGVASEPDCSVLRPLALVLNHITTRGRSLSDEATRKAIVDTFRRLLNLVPPHAKAPWSEAVSEDLYALFVQVDSLGDTLTRADIADELADAAEWLVALSGAPVRRAA